MTFPSATAAVRLAHFSDLHLTSKPLGWHPGDWFSKRLTGWMNLNCLGRGFRFRAAADVVTALVTDVRERRPDHLIFSGDATTLGFEAEFAHATSLLKVGDPAMNPGVAVPGNHDYYTRAAATSGLFERYFAPWQVGERLEDEVYPFAQQVGSVWLVGVNSSTGNLWPWDASGEVDHPQLQRLDNLLSRLKGGPRILVTHYPICLASGEPERPSHGLRNTREVVEVAARGGINLWLHGHRHTAYYHVPTDLAPFPVICAGSGTQAGHWSYSEYLLQDRLLQTRRRVYSPSKQAFVDGEVFTLELS